ncbi:unnamed protein product [Acanthoscelides obtectus]|uniref:Uncharacterized protein n=1 Tax=Acanthoscelides obtectus TaxID=200917 RepID=A0A9P0QKC5_ACAOB|nr:unnamed protein product [Acanthoscelides obtectus]CAK1654884.1 hypothetical protein AOBTE_LOCUS18911 [Acanthoscelides obtectus]
MFHNIHFCFSNKISKRGRKCWRAEPYDCAIHEFSVAMSKLTGQQDAFTVLFLSDFFHIVLGEKAGLCRLNRVRRPQPNRYPFVMYINRGIPEVCLVGANRDMEYFKLFIIFEDSKLKFDLYIKRAIEIAETK